jgi:hypothetical protein
MASPGRDRQRLQAALDVGHTHIAASMTDG